MLFKTAVLLGSFPHSDERENSEPVADGEADEAVQPWLMAAELEALDVMLDRAAADAEVGSDLLRGLPSDEQVKDLALPEAERHLRVPEGYGLEPVARLPQAHWRPKSGDCGRRGMRGAVPHVLFRLWASLAGQD